MLSVFQAYDNYWGHSDEQDDELLVLMELEIQLGR